MGYKGVRTAEPCSLPEWSGGGTWGSGLAQEWQFPEYLLPGDSGQDRTDAPTGAELRAAPRYTLLIRTAKIIADGREFLCIIRDVSATGLKIRLFSDLPHARELAVEMVTGDRYPVDLVWQADDHAGLRFHQDMDVQRLLDESMGPFPKRQVRLQIAVSGVLHSGGEAVPVIFRNLSQQGARVECDKWLLMNELVRIETGITPPLYAKVRWRSQPSYGLIFERTFRLEELARISAPLQFAEALQDHARAEADQAALRPI